jgi:hypothetical protein
MNPKEIEEQALKFAQEESYGELSGDLWKGFLFGAKWMKEKLKKMSSKLIGHVGVDSGQLLLCDPCYIDSEWKQEDFQDVRMYQHKDTKDVLSYRGDFLNYEQVIPRYKKTMNELLRTNEWEELKVRKEATHPFSYNACAQATLSDDGHGQLNFNLGHPGAGVAFSTAFGDGMYPVYAKYHADGTLMSVEVMFQDDTHIEWDNDEDDYFE